MGHLLSHFPMKFFSLGNHSTLLPLLSNCYCLPVAVQKSKNIFSHLKIFQVSKNFWTQSKFPSFQIFFFNYYLFMQVISLVYCRNVTHPFPARNNCYISCYVKTKSLLVVWLTCFQSRQFPISNHLSLSHSRSKIICL